MGSKSDPTRDFHRFFGLVVQKKLWRPSWRGWLIVFTLAFLAFNALWFRVYPCLAVTDRVNTKILVVEGWIHNYGIRAGVDEFRRGSYERVFATGGPVEGNGGYINDYQTEASVGADLLVKNGIPNNAVEMVPSRVMDRDRTYGSAVALRNWFREHNFLPASLNVLTEGVHARRSRLLFEKALGGGVKVGVIAVPNPDYDSRYWWRYSAGVKDISSETIAYGYARLFFYPSVSSSEREAPQTASASH